MSSSKKRRAEIRAMFGGKCAYCGCELPEKGWHEDHVEAIHRDWRWGKDSGGRSITVAIGTSRFPERDNNRFPSCAPCNILKGVLSVEDFREVVSERVSSLRKYSGDFRHAERFGRLVVIEKPVLFWFEQQEPPTAKLNRLDAIVRLVKEGHV